MGDVNRGAGRWAHSWGKQAAARNGCENSAPACPNAFASPLNSGKKVVNEG